MSLPALNSLWRNSSYAAHMLLNPFLFTWSISLKTSGPWNTDWFLICVKPIRCQNSFQQKYWLIIFWWSAALRICIKKRRLVWWLEFFFPMSVWLIIMAMQMFHSSCGISERIKPRLVILNEIQRNWILSHFWWALSTFDKDRMKNLFVLHPV